MYYRFIGSNPLKMEMVQYWKNGDAIQAKVTKKNGVLVMKMEGEKYDFPGFPRGHLLFGQLSKLKHEIKNQIFNESWALLEGGKDVSQHIRERLEVIYALHDTMRIEMVPPKRMVPAVREIYRAWTKASPETWKLRDLVCFVLHEDDAYRFRLQWIVDWMPFWLFNPVQSFKTSLKWLEHAEVIGDMKERIRLLRRVLLAFLKNEKVAEHFTALFNEINWKKVRMSKADKYYFRGKYFKVDLDKFDY